MEILGTLGKHNIIKVLENSILYSRIEIAAF